MYILRAKGVIIAHNIGLENAMRLETYSLQIAPEWHKIKVNFAKIVVVGNHSSHDPAYMNSIIRYNIS